MQLCSATKIRSVPKKTTGQSKKLKKLAITVTLVTQKLPAQAVPVIGAIGGAGVTTRSLTTFRASLGLTSSCAGSNGTTAKTVRAVYDRLSGEAPAAA
jgi:hypothetical protein